MRAESLNLAILQVSCNDTFSLTVNNNKIKHLISRV